MVVDARNLMVDRRHVPNDCVNFRPLSKQIMLDAFLDMYQGWSSIHDWYWCIRGTRGYKTRVHPL